MKILLDGKPFEVRRDAPVAVGLYERGIKVLTRSMKYHRPRGASCFQGKCPNCLMTVDGIPNVRTCKIFPKEGMRVRSQNSWPNAKRDVFSLLDKLSFAMPAGFYYRHFIRPAFLWPFYERALRYFTGLGELPSGVGATRSKGYELRTDVAVVGGGASGLAAAISAAAAGSSVTLVESEPLLGGSVSLYRKTRDEGDAGVKRMVDGVNSNDSIRVMNSSTVFGYYDSQTLGVVSDNRLSKLSAKAIVLATGCYEKIHLFENNDLPGIFTPMALLRLVNLWRANPGKEGVVAGNTDLVLQIGEELRRAGVKILMVGDREPIDASTKSDLKGIFSYTIKAAKGGKELRKVVLGRIDSEGRTVAGEEIEIECDFLCSAACPQPAYDLPFQAGASLTYVAEKGGYVPLRDKHLRVAPNVFAAGSVAGICSLEVAVLEGRLAGLGAAIDAGYGSEALEPKRKELLESNHFMSAELYAGCKLEDDILSNLYEAHGKRIACFCLDVPEKDVIDAVGDGYLDSEDIKRYTGAGTGVCQGKLCMPTILKLLTRESKIALYDRRMRVPTPRPPVTPILLGALADS